MGIQKLAALKASRIASNARSSAVGARFIEKLRIAICAFDADGRILW